MVDGWNTKWSFGWDLSWKVSWNPICFHMSVRCHDEVDLNLNGKDVRKRDGYRRSWVLVPNSEKEVPGFVFEGLFQSFPVMQNLQTQP